MKIFLISVAFVILFVGPSYAQTKSVTGTVVDHSTGASGNFEVIEVQVGNKKYEVYLFRTDLPTPKMIGNVTSGGRTVRIYYSRIVSSPGYAGELRATKIVEVKKSK